MNKLKLFLENFLIYGFGGVISKLIPLIMLPIVTRFMPDSSYFGISDMSNTLISLGSAFATMGMYDAMYRMFFEKEDIEYKKDICSTAFVFTLGTSTVIFLLMILLKKGVANAFFGDRAYDYIVYITAFATLVGATNSTVAAPTRMQNKRKIFLIMNTIMPIVSYSIAIPLLLNGYYIIALPFSTLISNFLGELVFWALNREWFQIKRFDYRKLKQLLIIGIPLLPNFLIYWIFNSSDKFMITNILGTSATGIYSVGSKLGHVSQLIYTAFAGGWQFFAFSTMKERNQVENNSKVFEYLGIISFGCSLLVFPLSHVIFNLLFKGEYVGGYVIAPYLFLAPLLQMLFQVAGNQFLVIKKTWPNLFILSSGAVLNIFLNIKLIPEFGIEGASIATLLGYVVSDILVVIVLLKMRLIKVSKRFLVAAVLLGGYILAWRLFCVDYIALSMPLAMVIIVIYLALYKKEFRYLFQYVMLKKTSREK